MRLIAPTVAISSDRSRAERSFARELNPAGVGRQLRLRTSD
ncbi:MAG TPA: hypothetical protein VNY08_19615 [Bradyrhizobium sp.]|nr:hypothetical protein [Bradyrhizobium sp.]